MTIEKVLQDKHLEYRESGKDFLTKCFNPEHLDSNPSLRIDKISGIFNCLSCGFSGNLFKYFNLEQPNIIDSRREKLKSLISKKSILNKELGIPPDAISFTREWRNISSDTLIKFEAFTSSEKEFVDRICFPIRNISKKIVGFCSRSITNSTPKYLISPAGSSFPLFPYVEPIDGRIILVEGVLDMLNLQDKGLTNSVCMFGVNKLTDAKIDLLMLQGIVGIDIFLDNDEAGQKAAKTIKDLIEKRDLKTRNIVFNNINDPGELTAQQVIKLKEKLYSG